MKINRFKTEYLCVGGKEDSKETVKMLGDEVARVKDFKYLGLTIQENGGCKREIKKRI